MHSISTSFLKIPVGERVWQMNHGDKKHIHYTGRLWIADIFIQMDLFDTIKDVLDGKRENK
jgi:hypothetical protein